MSICWIECIHFLNTNVNKIDLHLDLHFGTVLRLIDPFKGFVLHQESNTR